MPNIKILPEIESVLFPLQEEEFKLLEESILQEGIRDPLVVWPKGDDYILVDGHHRYKIAQKHSLPFRIKEMRFDNLDDVLEWVDRNQLGRRNLTEEEYAYVLGSLYERRKKQGERKDLVNDFTELVADCATSCVNDFTNPAGGSAATARAIAEEFGIGERTVRNAAAFAQAVDKVRELDQESAAKILAGKVVGSITHLPKVINDNPELMPTIVSKIKEKNSIKDALTEAKAEARKEKTKAAIQQMQSIPHSDKYKIIVGDMTTVQLDERFDFIITDPPYPREYLPLYEVLAKRAANDWLKEDGLLVVMTGQSYLDEILAMMTKYIDYYWTCAFLTPTGATRNLWQKQVNTFWKPVLVFGPKGYKGKTFGDVFESESPEKGLHEWQQSASGMCSIVKQICRSGQSILDPFCGTGTTGIAALKHNCFFTGIEIEEPTAKIAIKRLEELEGESCE